MSTVLPLLTLVLTGLPPSGCDALADSVRASLVFTVAAPSQAPAWAGDDVPEEVWRMAEAALGVSDSDTARCLLEAAEAEARRRLDALPDDVEARFALAAVLGLRADREGGRTQVRIASQLAVELERVLERRPDHARARHILGRLHAGVMRMSGFTRWVATNLLGGGALSEASWAGAEEHLSLAERAMPEVPDHHFELARLYDDTGRPDRAIEELRHVLQLRPRSAMEEAVHRKARALLVELDTLARAGEVGNRRGPHRVDGSWTASAFPTTPPTRPSR